ncbi:hypothetical protein [Microbulbifer sp. GL-2]|uniref:hypothetical protein n=1 Tax=Microbulbifer sp. GL-2 TaxID=2591606 RepID=UPI001164003C|nr:hypothetical protein [Microbulbifer sp. GL-2]BBM00187.1 hypothetical protein GL2_02610 [Microbulbifer sp. GL-2]
MDLIIQSALALSGVDVLVDVGLVNYQAQRIGFSDLEALWLSVFESGLLCL